jgi:hypothetical protein
MSRDTRSQIRVGPRVVAQGSARGLLSQVPPGSPRAQVNLACSSSGTRLDLTERIFRSRLISIVLPDSFCLVRHILSYQTAPGWAVLRLERPSPAKSATPLDPLAASKLFRRLRLPTNSDRDTTSPSYCFPQAQICA